MKKTNTNQATVDYVAIGRKAVAEYLDVLKAEKAEKKAKKAKKKQTAQEAVQEGDQKRTNILGAFGDFLNKYDALGVRMLKSEYMKCFEKSTVDSKTSLFALGKELDAATDRVIAQAKAEVKACIDNGLPANKALAKLTAVRGLKHPDGHSVPGALIRALLCVVETTKVKVKKFLGDRAEKGLWVALGKALKAFAGLIKLGIKIVYTVAKDVVCYVVAGATKLGQLFTNAFYMLVGVLLVKTSKQNEPVDANAEAAANELFDEFMADVEGFEFEDMDLSNADPF